MRIFLISFLLAMAAEVALAQAPPPNVNDGHLIGSWVGECGRQAETVVILPE